MHYSPFFCSWYIDHTSLLVWGGVPHSFLLTMDLQSLKAPLLCFQGKRSAYFAVVDVRLDALAINIWMNNFAAGDEATCGWSKVTIIVADRHLSSVSKEREVHVSLLGLK
jgi:hypothetical protein